MKRQVKSLLNNSINSLIMSVHHFNSLFEPARTEAVLIFLDHAFEMLLKAAILHRGGRIRERYAKQTIGFDKCVNKCLSDESIKCMNGDQAMTLKLINDLRDSAMHHLLDISEQQLYLHAQSGLTLFEEMLANVFNQSLSDYLPRRVMPISTEPPKDIVALFDKEIEIIDQMLSPGSRKREQAKARLRPIAVVERSLSGEKGQPSERQLNKFIRRIAEGENWQEVFPKVATLKVDTTGTGLNVTIHLSKTEGPPVKLVQEGKESAIVAVKSVDALGFYNLGYRDLAKHLQKYCPNVGGNRLLAVIKELEIRQNPDFYKEFRIGKTKHKRYSKKALEKLRNDIPELNVEELWQKHKRKLL